MFVPFPPRPTINLNRRVPRSQRRFWLFWQWWFGDGLSRSNLGGVIAPFGPTSPGGAFLYSTRLYTQIPYIIDALVVLSGKCVYSISIMKNGKPRRQTKADRLDLRVTGLEKKAFKQAADIAGITLGAWMRERLRRASIRELEEAGLTAPFLKPFES